MVKKSTENSVSEFEKVVLPQAITKNVVLGEF